MAKKINLNEAFVTDDIINDKMIEKAVYQNLKRIKEDKIFEIHKKLMEMIDAKSSADCAYFEIYEFKKLIENTRKNQEEKEAIKIEKTKAKIEQFVH